MTRTPRPIDVPAEQIVAQILGATETQAEVLVDRLRQAGLLGHGVAVVAAVAAARWGVELGDAVVAMADGREVPAGLSDYELRTAAEEAEADLEAMCAASRHADAPDHARWRQRASRGAQTTEGDDQPVAGGLEMASPYAIDIDGLLRE